jgi:myxalamid-type polyketide synthase MxaE and MxaD
MDLDPAAEPAQAAYQLVAELRRSGASQRVLRAGNTLGRALDSYEVSATPAPPYRWDPGGAYLITGGLGGVGLAASRWMIERGARRLILLGRTRLPERGLWRHVPAGDPMYERIEAVLRLEDLGAQVQLAAVDLARPGELAAWLGQYEQQGGRPIRGVLHTAVVNEDRLLIDQDAEALRRGFLAKAQGALDLATLLPGLDFYVFFSSVIALFGPAGTAVYAAANAYLDALAWKLRGAGCPVVSVNWGAWKRLGLARVENVGETIDRFEVQGIRSFSAAEGLDILGRIIDRLAGGVELPACVAVIPIDWQAYRQTQSPRFGEDLFARQLHAAQAQNESTIEQTTAALTAKLIAVAPGERRQLLVASLEPIVRRVFHLVDGAIDHQRPLGLMGMDSLMGIELRNQIQILLGLKLPATFVWNYPTLSDMAARLCTLLEGEQPAGISQAGMLHPDPDVQAPQTQSAIQDVLQRVSSLSDDEALQKLLGAA